MFSFLSTESRLSGGCRDSESHPLVSVIVVVYRDAAELGHLIANLAPFRGKDLEVVIVDGGSEDGSVELLRTHEAEIDFWLSERDSGLYEGMNKGLAAARGEFVLHINAGDRLWQVPFEALRAAAPDCAAVACRMRTDRGTIGVPYYDGQLKRSCTIHHQGTFYRRAMHTGYDATLRMAGDFDWNQRMMLAGMKVELREEMIALHAEGGLSDDRTLAHEHLAVVRKNFGWWQMQRSRVECTRLWRQARHAMKVGPARVMRSAWRQAGEKLRGDARGSEGSGPKA